MSQWFQNISYTVCNPHPCLARERNRGPWAELYYAQYVQTEFLLLISPVDEYILTLCLYMCICYQHQYLFKCMKHSGDYMYHLLQHSKTLWFCSYSDFCTKWCYAVVVFMQWHYVLCAPWTELFLCCLSQCQDSAGWKKYKDVGTDVQ
jgi:hypothetical protein